MSPLRLLHLRFHLLAEQPLRLPALNKGNSLRGGFGSAFRKLVCVDLRWECADCSLRYQCPYTQVFNPFIPPDAPQFSGNRDIPRPFVVKPPLTEHTQYDAEAPLLFEMVLIGRAIDYLPYFIVAFRELGAGGFGLNRARVRLDRVDAVGADGALAPVYEAGTNVVRLAPPLRLNLEINPYSATPVMADWAAQTWEGEPPGEPYGRSAPRERRPPSGTGDALAAAPDEITLEFLTPTTLKAGSDRDHPGAIVRRPAFHHIVKRLRDRVNALATFYGDGPLALDFKGIGVAAEAVETVRDATHWVERRRHAGRRGVEHDLSGFAGRLTVRGELAPFLPLLRVGEYVHVGKNAVFGNGWFVLHMPPRA